MQIGLITSGNTGKILADFYTVNTSVEKESFLHKVAEEKVCEQRSMRESTMYREGFGFVEESYFALERMTLPQCTTCARCAVCNNYRQQLLSDIKASIREQENFNTTTHAKMKTEILKPVPQKVDLTSFSQTSNVPMLNKIFSDKYNSAHFIPPNRLSRLQSSTTITIPASSHCLSPSVTTSNFRYAFESGTTSSFRRLDQNDNDMKLAKESLHRISESCQRLEEKFEGLEKSRKHYINHTLTNTKIIPDLDTSKSSISSKHQSNTVFDSGMVEGLVSEKQSPKQSNIEEKESHLIPKKIDEIDDTMDRDTSQENSRSPSKQVAVVGRLFCLVLS